MKSGNSKLTLQVPGKGILLSKPVPPPNTGDGKVTSLDGLPTDWWTVVDNASGGYQYKTLTEICGVRVETMLDGCAGSNHVTEELVCGMLNKAKELGLKPDDPKFPVVQMERWVHAEAVHGIAASSPVPLKGAGLCWKVSPRKIASLPMRSSFEQRSLQKGEAIGMV